MKTLFACFLFLILTQPLSAQSFNDVFFDSDITEVQPMTGIVFWVGNNTNSDAIALEYSYMLYNEVVTEKGVYDWKVVDDLLDEVASRGHQAILRFRFTYVGYQTAVPDYIKALDDYHETEGISEDEITWFPDWEHQELREFTIDFYTKFAERYDNDSRLAFLQTGFGLWGEYHIYDGPFVLGKTFPSKDFQEAFLIHLNNEFNELPWSISIDARDDTYSPFEEKPILLELDFGNFDDSFMALEHPFVNAHNWNFFGASRYVTQPAGGEFSYYTDFDQEHVLDLPNGAHGISYEKSAKDWQITYMIGNDQPGYQSMERIKEASLATGYKFQITSFKSNADSTILEIKNVGIAPFYYDAFPAIKGVKSDETLKYLAQGQSRIFHVSEGGLAPDLTIACDYLVVGQHIDFFGTSYVPVAAEQAKKPFEIKVFPTNLKKGNEISIYIQEKYSGKAILTLCSSQGTIIDQKEISMNERYSPKVSAGMYLLTITTQAKSFVQKIIIQ